MATKRERAQLLLDAANNPILQAALIARCRLNPCYFINNFVWTYNPRVPGGRVPFNLYPFQEDEVVPVLREIIDASFNEKKEDLLIDKSRDMGVSWLILAVFLWYWLFASNANFLLGSRKQDYVDTLGDISTLFPKIRFMIKWLPTWMLPTGYDSRKHDGYMKIINPVTDSTITGESTNQDFARGGRYNAVLFDEFPKWSFDDAAWGSAYQSTPCRIAVGTPYGKGNKFAQLRFGKGGIKIRVMSIHWRKHPEKDDAWYAAECARATKDEIARELDISYEMSIGGIVLKEMNPQLHVVRDSYNFQKHARNLGAFDFGTTCASLLCQEDDDGILHVGKELILFQNGNTQDLGQEFLTITNRLDLDQAWETTCDPAGIARSGQDREESTHIKILNDMGIFPEYETAQKMRDRLVDGLQLLRTLFSTLHVGKPRILIYEDGCPILMEALQSEYRYKENANGELTDIILQKHPWEDIMDCLRYIIIYMSGGVRHRRVPRAAVPTQNRNRYTGYKA